VIFRIGNRPVIAPEKVIRDYGNADWETYRRRVTDEMQPFAERLLSTPEDVEEQCRAVTEAVTAAMEDAVPRKTVRPWNYHALPQAILQNIKRKNSLRKVFQETRCPLAKARLNTAQHQLRDDIAAFRSAAWEKRLASLNLEDGSIWRMARALRSPGSEKCPLNTANGPTFAPQQKADCMADHLEASFKTAAAEPGVPDPLQEPVHPRREARAEIQRDERPPILKPQDLHRAIKTLKMRKAAGPDGIANEALRYMPVSLAHVLLAIFNACLLIGHFPEAWKRAKVICLPKPGKPPSAPESYRPISLLNTMGKLLEKMILEHLKRITEILNIIPEHQFGFREEHSTTHQLVRVLNFVADARNFGQISVGAFFDISKAFDRVWHAGLLHKLRSFGYPDWLTALLRSWLQDRSFSVIWGGESSTTRQIEAGVPQGSVLSPILFSVFSADMPCDFGRNVMAALYADDTALIARSANGNQAARYLQRAVDALTAWYSTWRITINASKTQTIVFTSRPRDPGEILVGHEEVLWQTSVTYLGVIIDRRTTFSEHAQRAVNAARSRRMALAPILGAPHIPVETRLRLVDAIIRPVLTYASPAWSGSLTGGALRALEVMHRSSLRTCLRLGWTPSNETLYIISKTVPLGTSLKSIARTFFEKAENSSTEELRRTALRHTCPWDRTCRPRASTGDPEDLPPRKRPRLQ
jgi:retron-type reverse transcriptase